MDAFYNDLERVFLSLDITNYIDLLREQIQNEHIPGETSMLPSFLETMPTGDEKGDFLALDLGGSTFRVAIIRLLGERQSPTILMSQSWMIDESAKVTDSRLFFDWLAGCVAQFLKSDDSLQRWRCGLSFSFPVQETGINTGRIMLMGKGYSFSDDTGHECIKDQFEQAFIRQGLSIEIKAIVNDSLATMLSCNYSDPRTKLSVIVGTGCNASLRMPSATFSGNKMTNLNQRSRKTSHVLVNAEMSMFGNKILPWTSYDSQLNEMSCQPGYQTLEQFTSGRYMGELVRLILDNACREHQLFDSHMPMSLRFPFSFKTSTMSMLTISPFPDLSVAQKVLHDQHPKQDGHYTLEEAQFIRAVSHLVALRSAMLIAASLVALSSFIDDAATDKEILVAYCGTVIECYPGYVEACQAELQKLDSNLRLIRASDSGLIGAAVCTGTVSCSSC